MLCDLLTTLTTAGGAPIYECKAVGYFCKEVFKAMGQTVQSCADACAADPINNAAFTVDGGYCSCTSTANADAISTDSASYQSYAIGTPLDPATVPNIAACPP